jgi:hypothetical protein
MSTDSEENFLAPFDAFLASLDKHDEGEKLFMLAGLTELLRHTKSATDVFSIAELLASLPYVDWPRIPFSITKTLLSRGCHDDVQKLGVPAEHVPSVIRSGFLLFFDEFQSDPTATVSFDNLWENIKLVAETSFPPKPAANPKLPVAAPEIFNSGLLRRVFEPVKFTPELAEQLRLTVVKYRSLAPSGQLGPEVRGLAVRQPDKRFDVFLETGEFLQVPSDVPNHLVFSTAPEDFKHLSPAVMLMLVAACDDLVGWGILDAAQGDKIKAGSLGKIKGVHLRGTSDASDLQPLEHVFDVGREAARMGVTGATGPVGASIRIRVPASGTMVVIEASQDTYGPYSRSWLAQCQTPAQFEHKDVVLMRHEAPRHYSLRGVYLFPLQDRLVSLTIIF